nr:hypothetical protein NZ312_10310 [Clostridioides difficile]
MIILNDKEYLGHEEQFKQTLNLVEIDRIENDEIREIRTKYWKLKQKAFLDERNVKDSELDYVLDSLCSDEQKELEKFK